VRKRKWLGILLGIVSLLLLISIVLHVESYFNLSLISLASGRCYEANGEVILKIYNNFTGSYYFECKPK